MLVIFIYLIDKLRRVNKDRSFSIVIIKNSSLHSLVVSSLETTIQMLISLLVLTAMYLTVLAIRDIITPLYFADCFEISSSDLQAMSSLNDNRMLVTDSMNFGIANMILALYYFFSKR